MATSFQLDFTGLDEENLKTARSIQELWHGKIGEKEAIKLLRHNEWNRNQTVDFILKATDLEIQNVLNPKWREVVGMRRDEVLKELAKKDSIDTEIRQFACQEDSNMWWRRVPERKPVSRCYKCRRKYDALPRDREWGRAKYDCLCGNAFTGWGIMGVDSKVCFKCGNTCKPSHIIPPMKYDDDKDLAIPNVRIDQRMSNVSQGRGRGRGSDMQGRGLAIPNVRIDQRMSNVSQGQGRGRRSVMQGRGLATPNVRIDQRMSYETQGRGQGRGYFMQVQNATVNIRLDQLHQKPSNNDVIYGSRLHVSTGSTVNTFLNQNDIEDDFRQCLDDIQEEDDDD